MSGSTYTWVGTTTDWNTASNWSPATVPNSATVSALDTIAGQAVISGGATNTVANLTLMNPGTTSLDQLVLAGSNFSTPGTNSAGMLNVAGAITDAGGIVSTVNTASEITAASIAIQANAGGVLGEIGGGGTYVVSGAIANNGLIIADGEFAAAPFGPLVIDAGSISGSGGINVDVGTSLELNAPVAATQLVSVSPGSPAGTATLLLDQPGNLAAPIYIGTGQTLDLFLKGQTVTSATINAGNTLVVSEGGTTENFVLQGANLAVAMVTSSMPGYAALAIGEGVVCFARGTRIATPEGAVAVEDLQAGDLVTTAGGETSAVVWVGHRGTDCQRHPEPRKVWPVRIREGAFGPNLPERDLLVSPQHAIFDEGVLIPAKVLINGSTITQEPVARVEYYHVELARHDLLLAEGLPTESYLDTGDRASFENGGGAMILHPDFARWAWDARACAELRVTGPELDAVRAKLARRAEKSQRRPGAAVAAG